MYKLEDLSFFVEKWNNKTRELIVKGQNEIAEQLERDVKTYAKIPSEASRNRSQLASYIDSISKKPTEDNGDEVVSRVSSNMQVYWPKIGQDVFVGAFLEWGTGRLGESTNDYPHGFPYTTDGPWDAYTQQQYNFTGTYGLPATPHFTPAINNIKPKYREMIRKAIKEGFK